MTTVVVSISKGCSVAFGANWFALSGATSARVEANKYAKELNAYAQDDKKSKQQAWAVYSNDSTDMVALSANKKAKGAYPALSILAASKHVEGADNTLFLLDLEKENGYYVGAIVKGLPDIEYDIFTADLEEAKTLAKAFKSSCITGTRIVGNGALFDTIGDYDALTLSFEELFTPEQFDHVDKKWRYGELADLRAKLLLILIAALLIGGVVYQFVWLPKKHEIERKKMVEQQTVQQVDPVQDYKNQLAAAINGLTNEADASYIQTWANYIGGLKLEEGGWSLVTVDCTTAECIASYQRMKGATFSTIDDALKNNKNWQLSFGIEGTTAKVSTPLKDVPRPAFFSGYPQNAVSLHDFLLKQGSTFQRLSEIPGIKVSIAQPAPLLLVPAPEGSGLKKPSAGLLNVQAKWETFRAFSTLPNNVTVSKVFVSIPQPNGDSRKISDAIFALEGKFYVAD